MKGLQSFTNDENSYEDAKKYINLTSASAAWRSVCPVTISKCFAKAGFSHLGSQEDAFGKEDEIPLAQLFPQLKSVSGVSVENYARIDADVIIYT